MQYVDMQGHKIHKAGFNNDWLFLVSKWRQTLHSWVTVCSGIRQQQELLWNTMAFHFLGQIHHLKVQTLLNLYNQHGEIGLQPVLKTHKTSLTIQKVYYVNSSKYRPASGEKCKYAMSHKKFKVNSC